jgi:hypothetical protein
MTDDSLENLPPWIVNNLPTELYESTLFKFKVTLQSTTDEGNKQVEIDVLPCIGIDYENLEDDMVVLPSQYAFFSTVYSEVRLQANLLEKAVKIKKAKLVKKILNEAENNKIRLTQDQLKTIIEADDELNQTEAKYTKKQMQVGKLYYFLEALKMKSELMRSLAGFKKQENFNH